MISELPEVGLVMWPLWRCGRRIVDCPTASLRQCLLFDINNLSHDVSYSFDQILNIRSISQLLFAPDRSQRWPPRRRHTPPWRGGLLHPRYPGSQRSLSDSTWTCKARTLSEAPLLVASLLLLVSLSLTRLLLHRALLVPTGWAEWNKATLDMSTRSHHIPLQARASLVSPAVNEWHPLWWHHILLCS